MVTHPATDPVRPGLTWSLVVKGNALTVYATRASLGTLTTFYSENKLTYSSCAIPTKDPPFTSSI